jgi:hypothetical protein
MVLKIVIVAMVKPVILATWCRDQEDHGLRSV